MNRTAIAAAVCTVCVVVPGPAQGVPAAPAAKAQAELVDELVARMVAAEKALKSVELHLATSGTLGGGAFVSTKGRLRVLRGTQAALHQRFEFTFDDGIRGSSESAQTASGILWFAEDPAFGPTFVQIDSKLVADLDWAGEVLGRDDLPGMRDRRTSAPLGSALLAHAHAHFQLAATAGERAGEAGTWLDGPRKKGLDVEDPELPVADAIKLFVRAKDQVLLEVRHLQADKVVQQMIVEAVHIDPAFGPEAFEVDGRGAALKPVAQHQALADTIEQTLRQAEAKRLRELEAKQAKDPAAKDEKPEVRPSRR
ncbi:MAG: hypothetical protein WAT39_25430 [Planctomycetota bacterium]